MIIHRSGLWKVPPNEFANVFWESLGGAAHYARQPPAVKYICCGLKHGLILKKFRTAGQLREYLENLEWNSQA